MLQLPYNLHSPSLDLLDQVHIPLVLGVPELDAGLQDYVVPVLLPLPLPWLEFAAKSLSWHHRRSRMATLTELDM